MLHAAFDKNILLLYLRIAFTFYFDRLTLQLKKSKHIAKISGQKRPLKDQTSNQSNQVIRLRPGTIYLHVQKQQHRQTKRVQKQLHMHR